MEEENWQQRLLAQADEFAKQWKPRLRGLTDFYYDVSQDKFWDKLTKQLIAKEALDACIPLAAWPTRENARGELRPIRPSKALQEWDTGQVVESSTWWPGEDILIKDVYASAGGFSRRDGHRCFNHYEPPMYEQLAAKGQTADRWLAHVKRLYPDPAEHEHFLDWAAHMLQRPDEKCNHAIVLAGQQGIGKDSMVLPLRHGVGAWNTSEIGPDDVQSQFNAYVKSVLIVINEVRPHHEDFRATAFYNALKPLLAAPPEQLTLNEKYTKPIAVKNVCRVILTTNDPMAMHIPDADRRMFVMTSKLPSPRLNREVFEENYFLDLYQYFRRGGLDAAVLWLMKRDLSKWDPAKPPPSTVGKEAIQVASDYATGDPVEEVIATYLEQYPEPPKVVFGSDLVAFARATFFDEVESIISRLKGKKVHYAMERRGYRPTRTCDGKAYRHGAFFSRIAYVHDRVDNAEVTAAISRELRRRPLRFGADE